MNVFWRSDHCHQWFFNGFLFCYHRFQWFSMVLDHWSNDAMVSMDRCGLVGSSSISTGELITNQKLTIAPWFRMPSEPRVHPQENVTAMDTFRTPLLKLHGRCFGFSTRPHVTCIEWSCRTSPGLVITFPPLVSWVRYIQ